MEPAHVTSSPVRWGLLSTARINDAFLTAARLSPLAEVIAVSSRDEARARAYADARGLDRAYGSADELLADPDVEAVYLSMPNSLHVEWAIAALRAGKHVLCEKPLAVRGEQARAAAAAQESGRLLTEGFMYRHHPQTRRLVELVHGGAIGRLALIRASFSFVLEGAEGDPRGDAALEGGALTDLGCYCVSVARLLAGEPLRVHAVQRRGWGDVDIDFAATMTFPGDVHAQFDASLALPERASLEIVGSDGSIEVPDPWHCRQSRLVVRHPLSVEAVAVAAENPYRLEIEDLSRAIRGGSAPLHGADDAIAQARCLEALARSADEGVVVELAPEGAPSARATATPIGAR